MCMWAQQRGLGCDKTVRSRELYFGFDLSLLISWVFCWTEEISQCATGFSLLWAPSLQVLLYLQDFIVNKVAKKNPHETCFHDVQLDRKRSSYADTEVDIVGNPHCVMNSTCEDRLVLGVLILETEWFISEPKLLRQRHTDSSLSRPSVTRMQPPAVFIVDQLKRKQRAEVSICRLFFCSRQMSLHTWINNNKKKPVANMNPPLLSIS